LVHKQQSNSGDPAAPCTIILLSPPIVPCSCRWWPLQEFNAKTAEFKDVPLRVLIKVYEDKSYDWILKGPPSSWYIKQVIIILPFTIIYLNV
jgi:hypothetical protein